MGDHSYIWKALGTEFLGTFTLVAVGGLAVAQSVAAGGSLLASAFAFGLAITFLFYAWNSFSGAHFNPAVSFGFAVAGRMNWGLMLGYWIAQLLGGILAAALIAYMYGTASGVGASVGSLTNTDAWKAVLLEAILTFFLVITVLLVTRNPAFAVASGIAIGAVLAADMLAGAPLTGASMNPARSLGPALFSNNIGTYWIYVVGPLLGALVAALVYKLFTADFSCCDKVDDCGKKILDECGNPIKVCKRPVYDDCGRQIVDRCNGPQWENYVKTEHRLNHFQQMPHHKHDLMGGHDHHKHHGHHGMEKGATEVVSVRETVTDIVASPVMDNSLEIMRTPTMMSNPGQQTYQSVQIPNLASGVNQVVQDMPVPNVASGVNQVVRDMTVPTYQTVQIPNIASPLRY